MRVLSAGLSTVSEEEGLQDGVGRVSVDDEKNKKRKKKKKKTSHGGHSPGKNGFGSVFRAIKSARKCITKALSASKRKIGDSGLKEGAAAWTRAGAGVGVGPGFGSACRSGIGIGIGAPRGKGAGEAGRCEECGRGLRSGRARRGVLCGKGPVGVEEAGVRMRLDE